MFLLVFAHKTTRSSHATGKNSPNLLWSCLVPYTVPLGNISSWKPVRQYSCLRLRIPLRCSKSVSEPRCNLPSICPSLSSSNPAGASAKGILPSAWKLCKSKSSVPRNPPTSVMAHNWRDLLMKLKYQLNQGSNIQSQIPCAKKQNKAAMVCYPM